VGRRGTGCIWRAAYPPCTRRAPRLPAARRHPGDVAARRRCGSRARVSDATRVSSPRIPIRPRRSRRRTAGGGRRDGRRGNGRRESALCHPVLPSGSIARRNRATRVQAARRHPGGVAGRRRSGCGALRAPRIPIRAPAVAATEHGRRAPGRAAGKRAALSALCDPTPAGRPSVRGGRDQNHGRRAPGHAVGHLAARSALWHPRRAAGSIVRRHRRYLWPPQSPRYLSMVLRLSRSSRRLSTTGRLSEQAGPFIGCAASDGGPHAPGAVRTGRPQSPPQVPEA
jgi:hypothetical protein